jgi:tripartite-type tricarboxylate transporter receptor subunit TctC
MLRKNSRPWEATMTLRIARRSLLAGAAGLALAPAIARGQAGDYPNKPVRLIVPFPPGQAADVYGRLMAEELGKRWKQQVIVENRGGGAGVPAMEAGKQAAPDGYTLIMGSSGTLGVNPTLIPDLPYDSNKDFAAISNVFLVPLIIVAHPSFPHSTIKELVDAAKKDPGSIQWASAGVGTSQHLSMELFRSRAGIDITHVPYKGSGPAMQDLLAGHVKLMMDSVTSALAHIKSGKIKALGVTTAKRSPLLPEVPAIADSYAGFNAAGWSGLVAPAKTPPAIVAKINADAVAIINDPEINKKMIAMGGIPDPTTPAQYSDFIRSEVEQWGKVVRATGAKPG